MKRLQKTYVCDGTRMDVYICLFLSDVCAVCLLQVVSEFRRRGMEFILQAIDHPTYLEDLTGLTELIESANSFKLDWDDETDDADI